MTNLVNQLPLFPETMLPGKSEEIVYQNDNYKIVVGMPPSSREYPEPLLAYLIINKKFGVIEYFNQMLPYAKNMCDDLDKVAREGFPKKEENEAFPARFRN